MTDSVIDQMNITNASCVMHYSPAGPKTEFYKRLTTLAGTFTSSEVIMVISRALCIKRLIHVCVVGIALNQFLQYGKN